MPQPPRDVWEILAGRKPKPKDPLDGHTISVDGAREHDSYAASLVRDSNPDETARYLKNVINWSGDQGRGDVADLLGRFAKVDEAKAKALQDALHRASGERIPFRIAPTGAGMAAEAAGEDDIKLPEHNPFGSADGADRWEAGNMAKALLGKTDYGDAVTHFAGEFKRDSGAARAYTAAVYQEMAAASPKQAGQFAQVMGKAGLTEEVKKPEGESAPVQVADAGGGTMTDATPAPPPNPPVTAPPAPTEAPQTTPAEPTQPPATTQPPEPPATTPAPETPKPTGSSSGETGKPATRPPVEGHTATKSIEEIEKEAKANGGYLNTQQDRERGNDTQCTALVKHVTGIGQASEWRAGEKINGPEDPPLKPGTAIATFNNNGTYGTDKGRHAAIFLGYKTDENGQKGMEVLEQADKMPARRKFIPFTSTGKFIYQAGNYSVIKQ